MKRVPLAEFGEHHPRGLYIAPWLSSTGDLILLAIRADRRLNEPPLEIPRGADSVRLAEQMEARLDEHDPPHLRLL